MYTKKQKSGYINLVLRIETSYVSQSKHLEILQPDRFHCPVISYVSLICLNQRKLCEKHLLFDITKVYWECAQKQKHLDSL